VRLQGVACQCSMHGAVMQHQGAASSMGAYHARHMRSSRQSDSLFICSIVGAGWAYFDITNINT